MTPEELVATLEKFAKIQTALCSTPEVDFEVRDGLLIDLWQFGESVNTRELLACAKRIIHELKCTKELLAQAVSNLNRDQLATMGDFHKRYMNLIVTV